MSDTPPCHVHPDRPAIETCELCGKGLCGYCLYYTQDGQRLCETCAEKAKANGLTIIPPAVYAAGILPAQAEASRQQGASILDRKGVLDRAFPLYVGNDQDLNAFVAMGIGLLTLLSCCGASYLLPFLGLILGLVALFNASKAVDPRRTRTHAWVAVLTSGCFVTICLGVMAFYFGVFVLGISAASSSPASAPYVFPTSTASPPAPTFPFFNVPTPTPAPPLGDIYAPPPLQTAFDPVSIRMETAFSCIFTSFATPKARKTPVVGMGATPIAP